MTGGCCSGGWLTGTCRSGWSSRRTRSSPAAGAAPRPRHPPCANSLQIQSNNCEDMRYKLSTFIRRKPIHGLRKVVAARAYV